MDSSEYINEQKSINRLRFFFVILLAIFAIFSVRLFYLQIISHEKYVTAARNDQFREYEVDAERGSIYAQYNGRSVPLVLNQQLYTVYADPTLVKKTGEVARALAPILNENELDIRDLLEVKERKYVVLKKRVSDEDRKKVLKLEFPGIGAQAKNYRVYPQGEMAAQVLGFVDDEGVGRYGIEQSLNTQLAGQKGQLRAVTDVRGVPLAANTENFVKRPTPGKDIELTLDIGMQSQVEKIVKQSKEQFNSESVSVIVLESQTGAVKAMANYPSYDPANYQKVEDGRLFQNRSVSEPMEPGSIAKIFTAAAGIDSKAVHANSTYHDPGSWTFDGAKIVNVAEGTGTGQQSIGSMLNLSLNTGAAWVLMQMGGGRINDKARNTLHEYFTDHFRFDKATGIEQGYEGVGYVMGPEDKDNGITITYANMAFGQGFSATAIQSAAAMNAVINGGTYYQPTLVSAYRDGSGKSTPQKPKVIKDGVVSSRVSSDMIRLLDDSVRDHETGWSYMKFSRSYTVGGKTGTAELMKDNGAGYRDDVYNSSYLGFVGGDEPQYTIVVYNFKPRKYSGFAGANTGQPIFAEIAHMLIDKYGVHPKSN